MAKLSNSDSRRMYSWWWDSHISPKNSKWLQENLTEMDVNFKSMIKLLEEDADSFARRAEMYYKKRPELMKMVEEFYRAYRALAERYDHATGVIRHAHRTMSEAFPNQMSVMMGDESPVSAVSGNDPRTPDMMSTPNGEFAEEPDSCTERKSLKQFHNPFGSVERVRRGLNFDESDEKEQSTNINGNSHVKDSQTSKPNQESDPEEILALKEGLAKLEAEKEAGLIQYQQSLDKLSQLKTEISKTREDFKTLTDHAKQAEKDVSVLTEKLIALEAEKESKLQEYLQSIDKLSDRANIAENEIDKLSVEKDAALDQYMQSLEIISKLENTLRITEENATCFKERAEKAENEVEMLKNNISELTKEKEIIARKHQQCLESISSLELKLSTAEEQRLFLESSNQSLHSELETLMSKLGTQTQELTEKEKELGRLWGCVQEERMRFVEAETAFQTLQHLHAQTQEELRAMALELQNRDHLLNVSETQNQSFQNEISNLIESKGKLEGEVEIRLDERNALQQEIYCLKEELKDLNEKHISVLGQVREVGLSPESLGSSVKELMDENSRLISEKAALLEKLEILEQLIVKNSILETSLSDLNAELEAVRGKMEALEKSCESLLNEKSGLLDEKASLVSQLQETNKNLEILSKNNAALETFLSDVHHQLETLMTKSKTLEDSCQLLVDEKAGLMGEKDSLTSQLKNTETRLEDLGRLYAELEGRCVNLEKEKETTLRKVDELNMSLEVERRGNANYIQTSEAKMCVLEDECQQKKRELDQVLYCAVANEIEIFVLRTISQVMKENNCSLLIKNQKLLKESSLSEKKISSLEQKNSEQQFEIRSLTDRTEQDQFYVNQLLDKLQTVKKLLRNSEEEKLESSIEFSVLVTWIRQLVIDAQNLEVLKNEIERDRGALLTLIEGLKNKLMDMRREKLEISDNVRHLEGKNNALEEENYVMCSKVLALENLSLIFKIFTDEKFMLFREIGDGQKKLRDTNDALIGKLSSAEGKLEESKIENVDLKERLHKIEDELSVEIENGKNFLNRMTVQLLESQEKISQVEKQKLELNEMLQNLKKDYDEEKRSLMDNIGHLEGKNNAMDAENYDLCSKVLALENLWLIFKIFADEKFMMFREIEDDRNKLHDMNAALMGKLEESKTEIENGKKMLNQIALQLLEAEEKMSQVERQKLELNESVQNLKTDYDEVTMARSHQENHILKLSADNERLSSENSFLLQSNQKLEADLGKLQIEHDTTKIHEENLSFELQKKVNEIDELEIQAALIFGQLQDSIISRIIYEQKFHELNDVCVGYMDENEGLESQLAAYGPEIVLLKECISSLENHTDIHIKFENPENEELQVARVANEDNNKSSVPSSAADLHNLTVRLRVIVKAAAELKEVMVQENINLHSKLDDATKQIESLQSEKSGGQYRRSSRRSTSEITEADNILLTKDIVLDQISDGSSYYSLNKRQPDGPDAQMVELWETPNPSTKKKSDLHRLKSMKEQKSTISTSDFSSVDKLEISKGSNESFGEGNNKTKILERLDSDVQKLANLQITVQDLKRKLEVTEKGKRGKAVIECESLKVQLEEADVAVMKMFELNGRLMKSIDDLSEKSFSDVRSEKSSFDLENEGTARRRVSEQARRMSEKIGRLHLEVQKLQFVLMKMDDGKDGKSRVPESKRRVLLRDFLYGGGRNGGQRRRKFCACMQPSTVED